MYSVAVSEDYSSKYDVVTDIYDQYVAVDFDVPFWINECRKYGEVLELASGTGRITVALAREGVKVTALDISESLLNSLQDKVRREKLPVEILRGDMRRFRAGRKYPLIILPFQSLQELVTPEEQFETLKTVREHLQHGGHFIVSIHNPEYRDARKGSAPLGQFVDRNTGHVVKFFNHRSVQGHLARNEQVYEEYDGDNKVSERKFVNRSYVFFSGEFEGLFKAVAFQADHVWGGYNYGLPGKDQRYLVYDLMPVSE